MWLDRCRKWCYPNRPLAMDRLVRIRRERGEVGRVERSVYHCDRCGGWHLTGRLSRVENDRAPELRGPSKRLVIA